MNLKNLFAASSAAIALTAGASAQAGDYYLSVFGGLSTLDSDIRAGVSSSQSNQLLDWDFNLVKASGFSPITIPFSTLTGTFTGYVLSYLSFTTGTPTGVFTFTKAQAGVTANVSSSQFTQASWRSGFDNGFVVGAAIGWNSGDNWRGELEIAYRQHDVVDSTRVSGLLGYGVTGNLDLSILLDGGSAGPLGAQADLLSVISALYTGTGTNPVTAYLGQTSTVFSTRVSSSGEASTWSYMINFWRDFDMGGKVTPFIGGGLGFAHMSLDYRLSLSTTIATYRLPATSFTLPQGTFFTYQTTGSGTNITGTTKFTFGGSGTRTFGGTYSIDDDDWRFAYQFGAGLGLDLGNNMQLTAQYRYFSTFDAFEFGGVEVDADSHNFMVGLTIPLQNLQGSN